EGTPIVHAEHGVVPPELILGSPLSGRNAPPDTLPNVEGGATDAQWIVGEGRTGAPSVKEPGTHNIRRNEGGCVLESALQSAAGSRLFPTHRDGRQTPDGSAPSARSPRLRPVVEPASARFESISFELQGAIDLEKLARELVDPALGVL